MKKLLALVLALVMTLGLATVAANATYSDDDEITYKEAVEVMSAIGVLEGADGKFSPDLKLTREQAAKIVCYMLLGEKTAEKLAVSNAPFSDVAATRWSAPYIAYCAANNIINGIGNGAFDPTGALTGLAFAKMLLAALKIEGTYTGSNWAINVATAFTKEKLDDGAEDVALSSVISREEAAQFAFTAAKYNGTEKVYGVDENGDGVADKTFDDRTDALLYSQKAGNQYVGKVENTENSLLDEVFDVSSQTGTDKLGRPAVVYSCDDWDDDLTFADDAKYTFTAAKAYTVADEAAFNTDLNKELNLTAASKKVVVSTGDTVLVNNVAETNAYTDLNKGDQVEIYMNGDSKTDVAKVVIVRYDLVKVDDVKALTDKQIKSNSSNSDSKVVNATATVTLKDTKGNGYTLSKNYNTQIPGFDFAKGDWILVAKNGANEALDSKEAETVSGTINSTKGSKYGIDGTYYEATDDVTKDINTKGTWALNAAGQLAADVDVTEYTEDFVFIYRINDKTAANEDGENVTTYTAYGIANDGTKISKVVATKDSGGKTYFKGYEGNAAYELDKVQTDVNGGDPFVTAYKVNKDNKLEIADTKLTAQAKNATDDVDKSNSFVGTADGKDLYATNDTLFISKYKSGSSIKVKTVTGYKNVKIDASATPYYAVTNSSSKAIYVFVDGEAKNPTASESVVYAVFDGGAVYAKDSDDNETYSYTFLTADGDKTVNAKEENSTVDAFAQGKVFAYVVEDSKIEVKDYTVAGTTKFVSGSQLVVAAGSDEITIDTDSVKLYTVTLHTDSEEVEVESGASFNKTAGEDGYNVTVCYDKAPSDSDAKVVAVFANNEIDD